MLRRLYNWLKMAWHDVINPTKYVEVVIEKTSRTSALAPLIILNVVVGVPLLVIMYLLDSLLVWTLSLVIIGYLAISAVNKYSDLIKIDPQLLRSEQNQKEMRKLAIIEAALGDQNKTLDAIVKDNPELSEVVEDPETKQLEGEVQ